MAARAQHLGLLPVPPIASNMPSTATTIVITAPRPSSVRTVRRSARTKRSTSGSAAKCWRSRRYRSARSRSPRRRAAPRATRPLVVVACDRRVERCGLVAGRRLSAPPARARPSSRATSRPRAPWASDRASSRARRSRGPRPARAPGGRAARADQRSTDALRRAVCRECSRPSRHSRSKPRGFGVRHRLCECALRPHYPPSVLKLRATALRVPSAWPEPSATTGP